MRKRAGRAPIAKDMPPKPQERLAAGSISRPKKKRRVKILLLFLFVLLLVAGTGVVGVRMRFPVRHLDVIRAHAGEFDPSWILAVIMAESSFRPQSESRRGAQGLMQLMPTTAEWIAQLMQLTDFEPSDVWRPEVNIAIGSFYLNRLLNQYNGNIRTTLAAYNAGQGNVRDWLNDPSISPDGHTLDNIPFSETRHYIERVMFNQRIYAFLLLFYR